MIKINEMRNMTIEEIRQKVTVLKKDLYGLRGEAKLGRIEKPHRISQTRKDIARCETAIREKLNAKEPKK